MKPRYVSVLQRNLTVLALVSTGVIATLWCARECSAYRQQVTQVRDEYARARKAELISRVDRVMEYISETRLTAERRLRHDLIDRVDAAHTALRFLYQKHAADRTAAEVEGILRDALGAYRWDNGRSYYFAIDLQGIMMVHPVLEVGRDFSDLQDPSGKYIIQDAIRAAGEGGHGFRTYEWEKPPGSGIYRPKLSCVKRFEPLGWIVGIGRYLDDEEEILKQEVRRRLSEFRYDDDSEYVFVTSFEGVAEVHGTQPEMVGKNVRDLADRSGFRFIREFIRLGRKEDGGFVEYVWNHPGTGRPTEKLSYVRGMPDWGWVVGTGMHVGEADGAVAAEVAEAKRFFLARVTAGLGMLLALLGLGYAMLRTVVFQAREGLGVLSSALAAAATEGRRIDLDQLRYVEFDGLGADTNRILDQLGEARSRSEQVGEGKTTETEAQPLGVGDGVPGSGG